MILLDSLAPLLGDLALADLMMSGRHLLQIDSEHSACHSCDLKLGEPFILLEVDL